MGWMSEHILLITFTVVCKIYLFFSPFSCLGLFVCQTRLDLRVRPRLRERQTVCVCVICFSHCVCMHIMCVLLFWLFSVFSHVCGLRGTQPLIGKRMLHSIFIFVLNWIDGGCVMYIIKWRQLRWSSCHETSGILTWDASWWATFWFYLS